MRPYRTQRRVCVEFEYQRFAYLGVILHKFISNKFPIGDALFYAIVVGVRCLFLLKKFVYGAAEVISYKHSPVD